MSQDANAILQQVASQYGNRLYWHIRRLVVSHDDAFFGTLDEINEHFKEMNWSDGLPVVPPTFKKVESFLKYTDMKWDETVAILPIAHRDTKVWHVAVNAVMAGLTLSSDTGMNAGRVPIRPMLFHAGQCGR